MKKRTHSLKPRLEVLEDRRLLAILLGPDGTLYLTGTESPDHLRVTESYINVGPNAFPIYVPGITAIRTDTAGSVLETFSFRASRVTTLYLGGLGGSDLIRNDTTLPSTIDAGSGLDSVFGGYGDDVINGNNNVDLLDGRGGDDVLSGGAGNDVLRGGEGNDSLRGGGRDDALFGGPGNDDLVGGWGNDVILGEGGNDSLSGNGGTDWLFGGSGNDQLTGGDGQDFLFGDTPAAETMETLADWGDIGSTPGDSFAELPASTALPVPPDVSGDLSQDTTVGGRDSLFGLAGNDIMLGEEGADELHGGDGNDLMFGGLGEDSLAGGAGSDVMDDKDILPYGVFAGEVDVNQYIFEIGDALVRYGDGYSTFMLGWFWHVGPPVAWVVDGPYDGHFMIII